MRSWAERLRQEYARPGPGRAPRLQGDRWIGDLRGTGPPGPGTGGAGPGGPVPGLPVSGRDPRRQQRVFSPRGVQRNPEGPRARGGRLDGFPGPAGGEAQGCRVGSRDHESGRQLRVLRRREEAQRDPPDGRATAQARHPGRDRFGAGHRRAPDRCRRRQHAPAPGQRDDRGDPLSTPAQLHRPGLRARALGGPDGQVRGQGAGAGARGSGVRVAGGSCGVRLVSETFVQEFEALSTAAPAKSPDWLEPVRRSAMERFARTGFPPTRDEEWRFTPIAPIVQGSWRPPGPTPVDVSRAQLDPFIFGHAEWITLVFVNGAYGETLSAVGELPAGVRIGSLSGA